MIPVLCLMLATSTLFEESGFRQALVDLRCETGSAFLQQGLLEEAESEFREALDLDPLCNGAILGLGRIYSVRGAWESAESYLRQYVEAVPDDPDGLLELARLLSSTDRHAEACLLARSSAEISTHDGEAWLVCGAAALAASDTAQASFALGRAIETGGRPALEAAVLMSGLLLSRARTEEAVSLLASASDAGYAPASYRLGRLYISWGDFARGSALVNHALSLEPSASFADSARIILDGLAESGCYFTGSTGN